MKQNFDDLTDLVEHAQNSQSTEDISASKSREVENSQGEKIILNDKIRPDTF
jgi:hypothetical protein